MIRKLARRRARWLAWSMAVPAALAVVPSASGAITIVRVPTQYLDATDGSLAQSVLVGGELDTLVGSTLVRLKPSGKQEKRALAGPGGLRGSSSRLVVLPQAGGVLAAASGGTLTQVETCATREAALEGDTLAYLRTCGTGGTQLIVRDLQAQGVAATTAVPGTTTHLSLSGRFVAYNDGTSVIVRNWAVGSTIFSSPPETERSCDSPTPAFAADLPGPCFGGLAVESDGSVTELIAQLSVIIEGHAQYQMSRLLDECHGHLSRFAAGSASPQRLLDGLVCGGGLRASAGHVLALTNAGLQIAGISGATNKLGGVAPILAFDGTNVTAVHSTCNQVTVESFNPSAEAGLVGTTDLAFFAACQAHILSARLLLSRHPVLKVRFRCPDGCTGPLVAAAAQVPGRGLFSGLVVSANPEGRSRAFSLAPGKSMSLTIWTAPGLVEAA